MLHIWLKSSGVRYFWPQPGEPGVGGVAGRGDGEPEEGSSQREGPDTMRFRQSENAKGQVLSRQA